MKMFSVSFNNGIIKKIRLSCMLILFLFIALKPFAQNGQNSINWKLDASNNGVNFYHSFASCNGEKVVLLRFINNNKYAVKVSWKELFGTKELSEKIKGFNGEKNTVVEPGQLLASGCNEMKSSPLLVLPSDVIPTHKAQIESFEYFDINVSIAK